MNIRRKVSVLCAAAILLSLTGCKQGGAAASDEAETLTQPAVETVYNKGAAASSAYDPSSQQSYETTVINGESYIVMTTSSGLYETTKAPESEDAPVMTAPDATFSKEDVKLTIESGADRITTAVDHITLRTEYTGPGNVILTTGEQYSLEKYENGSWRTIDFAGEKYWIMLAYEISAYSRPTFEISLEDGIYTEPITAGKYRVAKQISSIAPGGYDTYYAEFEVEDSDSEPQYEVAEENGYIKLRIVDIQPDKYECVLTFPHPDRYFVICNTSDYPDLCIGDDIDVDFSVMYRISERIFRIMPTSVAFSTREMPSAADTTAAAKPVIYLYPEKRTQVDVKLDYNGEWTLAIPKYRDGWTVTANPDGTLECEGKEYPYLFWEGRNAFALDTSHGFCVSGEDTEAFLSEKLSYLGLNESEAEEFMEYWLPLMRDNAYNVITFAGEDYTDNAALDITPMPETVIRVFMAFTPSEEPVAIPAQQLAEAPARNGFTVVEWGGAIER